MAGMFFCNSYLQFS